MPHLHTLEELIPPWVADESWQQTSDSTFKSLAVDGGLTLQLQGGGLHQEAMQAAYACSKDLLNHQALGAKAFSAPGASLSAGWRGSGYQQEFSYQSGPRPAGDLSSQHHSTLQKAMAACQDVCVLVLNCLAASRGVRLPPAALQRLVEKPPFDPQHCSAAILHAFSPSAGLASGTGPLYPGTPAAGDPQSDGAYENADDPALLTLVYAPGLAGLEVLDAYGEWQAVDPLGKEQVLLIPGRTLEHALCGLLPAAQYSVVPLEAGVPQGHCLIFELRPAPGTVIDFTKELDEAGHAVLARRYPPMTGADLQAYLSLNNSSVAPRGLSPALPLVPLPATAPARLEACLDAGAQAPAQAPAQAEAKTPEDASSQSHLSVGTTDSSASDHGSVAVRAAPGLASSGASYGATHQGQRGKTKKLKKVPSSPAVFQADGPGTAGGTGVPGERHTTTMPSGSQEAVLADEMLELCFKLLSGRVVHLTVSQSATFASILLAYEEKFGIPPDQVRLVSSGGHLEKDRTPADYSLPSGTRIFVVTQADLTAGEYARSQLPPSVGAEGPSASDHDRAAACVVPGLASGGASGGATLKGQRGKKNLKKVPSSAAVLQADSPGTADNAGVPGKRNTSTEPPGGQEAVWADEMLELVFRTLTGRVDRLTVSRLATFASILLSYQEKEGTPPDQLRLIFAEHQLEKDRTPADYGMTSGDVVNAVHKLRGD